MPLVIGNQGAEYVSDTPEVTDMKYFPVYPKKYLPIAVNVTKKAISSKTLEKLAKIDPQFFRFIQDNSELLGLLDASLTKAERARLADDFIVNHPTVPRVIKEKIASLALDINFANQIKPYGNLDQGTKSILNRIDEIIGQDTYDKMLEQNLITLDTHQWLNGTFQPSDIAKLRRAGFDSGTIAAALNNVTSGQKPQAINELLSGLYRENEANPPPADDAVTVTTQPLTVPTPPVMEPLEGVNAYRTEPLTHEVVLNRTETNVLPIDTGLNSQAPPLGLASEARMEAPQYSRPIQPIPHMGNLMASSAVNPIEIKDRGLIQSVPSLGNLMASSAVNPIEIKDRGLIQPVPNLGNLVTSSALTQSEIKDKGLIPRQMPPPSSDSSMSSLYGIQHILTPQMPPPALEPPTISQTPVPVTTNTAVPLMDLQPNTPMPSSTPEELRSLASMFGFNPNQSPATQHTYPSLEELAMAYPGSAYAQQTIDNTKQFEKLIRVSPAFDPRTKAIFAGRFLATLLDPNLTIPDDLRADLESNLTVLLGEGVVPKRMPGAPAGGEPVGEGDVFSDESDESDDEVPHHSRSVTYTPPEGSGAGLKLKKKGFQYRYFFDPETFRQIYDDLKTRTGKRLFASVYKIESFPWKATNTTYMRGLSLVNLDPKIKEEIKELGDDYAKFSEDLLKVRKYVMDRRTKE